MAEFKFGEDDEDALRASRGILRGCAIGLCLWMLAFAAWQLLR